MLTHAPHPRRTVLGVGLVAAMALAAGLVLTGGAKALPLADSGTGVRWALPLTTVLRDIFACLTMGLLLLASGCLPGRDSTGSRSQLIAPQVLPVVRQAAIAAAGWSTCALIGSVLTFARAAGIAPTSGQFLGQYLANIAELTVVRMSLLTGASAALIAAAAAICLRRATVGWLLGLTLAALWPLALSGHSAGAADHELAVDSLFGHVVAAGLWAGGLFALVLQRRRLDVGLAPTVARFSTVAGWCFAVVALTGVINVAIRVDQWADLAGPYGILLATKAGGLVIAGLAGWQHRRRRLAELSSGAGGSAPARLAAARPFWRLVTGEVLVLAAAVGAAVALAAAPPPATGVGPPVNALTGYPIPGPLTASAWVATWRLDLLWTTVAIVLLAAYCGGGLRLHRRGDRWPPLRLLSFALGCATLVWATGGAPGVYGRFLFSAHMVGHMTVTMLVPTLLVLAAPLTLALRALPGRQDGSWGPREWLLSIVHSRLLTGLSHPLVAPVVFVGSLIVFYYTPLLELSLRTHTGHVLMHAHFLLSGYLFAAMLIGVDPGPARPAYPLRLVILFATMAFHAFFGIALVSGSRLLAPDFFAGVPRPWGDSAIVDQQLGGAVAWGIGEIPVLAMAIAISIAWVTSDERQARRSDRQADRDGDGERLAYNRQLARLAERDRAQ